MNGQNGRNGEHTLSTMGAVGTAQGFFSPMTKVYIGDVLDHLEIIVSNMDQFVATCDHLTDYVFVSVSSGQAVMWLMAECAIVPDKRVDGTTQYRHSRLFA